MRTHVLLATVFSAILVVSGSASAKNGPIHNAVQQSSNKDHDKNHKCTPPDHSKARSHACPNTEGHKNRPPFCDPDDDCTPNSSRG